MCNLLKFICIEQILIYFNHIPIRTFLFQHINRWLVWVCFVLQILSKQCCWLVGWWWSWIQIVRARSVPDTFVHSRSGGVVVFVSAQPPAEQTAVDAKKPTTQKHQRLAVRRAVIQAILWGISMSSLLPYVPEAYVTSGPVCCRHWSKYPAWWPLEYMQHHCSWHAAQHSLSSS